MRVTKAYEWLTAFLGESLSIARRNSFDSDTLKNIQRLEHMRYARKPTMFVKCEGCYDQVWKSEECETPICTKSQRSADLDPNGRKCPPIVRLSLCEVKNFNVVFNLRVLQCENLPPVYGPLHQVDFELCSSHSTHQCFEPPCNWESSSKFIYLNCQVSRGLTCVLSLYCYPGSFISFISLQLNNFK